MWSEVKGACSRDLFLSLGVVFLTLSELCVKLLEFVMHFMIRVPAGGMPVVFGVIVDWM